LPWNHSPHPAHTKGLGRILRCMEPGLGGGGGEPRWQYTILWRYGPLMLVIVGLLAMGFGAAGVAGASESVTLVTLGFISLVSGVVLPRIDGKFTAGPSGLSADMVPVHQLDRSRYVISGPAISGREPPPPDSDEQQSTAQRELIKLGDVWDALEAAGVRPLEAASGSAYFGLPDGRLLRIPNRSFFDSGIASDELLSVLESWGIRPQASGNYPHPPNMHSSQQNTHWGSILHAPRG
jgi:hypothetical protein